MKGADLGALVGDKDSAKKGAMIGGSVGLLRSVSEASREEAEREAYERQEAERQRIAAEQQQVGINRLKAEQAAQQAAGSDPNSVTVVEVQKSLIRLGFDPGPVNGVAGPETKAAVKQYQAQHGLLEDGNVSDALLTHLLKNGG